MRRTLPVAALLILTLGISGAGAPAAAQTTLPGLGQVDGWVDATGDQMFGNLDMDVNSVLFRTLALNADSAGNLQWDGDDVCVAGSVLAGCAGAGDITAVTAGAGLTGGGTTGSVTLSVAAGGITSTELASNAVTSAKISDGTVSTSDLAFDPATQAELDTHKSSGDHDTRYAAAGHDHDVMYAAGSVGTVSGSGTTATATTLSVTTPDKCTGAENHRYLVTVSGWGVTGGTNHVVVQIEPTIDSASMTFGNPLRQFTLDAATNDQVPYHNVMLLTTVQPGNHDFRVLARTASSVNGNGWTLPRADMVVEHLGWSGTGC